MIIAKLIEKIRLCNIKPFRSALSITLLLLVSSSLMGPCVMAAALSKTDQDAIDGTWVHWTLENVTKTACGSVGSTGGATAKPGKAYVIGDSIGTQFVPGLETALNGSSGGGGWQVRGNVIAGRNLPQGLTSIDIDGAYIGEATAVIVELGTNFGGFTATNVDAMANKIHGYNKNVVMYWIDTAVVNTPGTTDKVAYANSLSSVNTLITSKSATDKYTVIPWNKTVFGANADPTKINPAAPDTNKYIRTTDGYNVHLTDAGIAAYTKMIVGSLGGGGGAAATSATSASCSCSSSTLAGSDNAEKIWNFLISKGLSGPQAAGIMGNLQQESGFDPAADQGGPGGVDGASGNAYGIAQWDSGRRLALEAAAKAQGVAVSDLSFQLNYLYNESVNRTMRDNSSVGEWDGLKLVSKVDDAAFYWHYNFERSGDTKAQIGERITSAVDVLSKYGSSVSSGGGGGCTVSANALGVVQMALSYSWPDRAPQSIALIPKPEYAAAIKSIFPGAPYGGADCGSFVGIVMHASGADTNYPLSGTPGQENYVRSHPELYDIAEVSNIKDLVPGDILIVNGSQGGGGADGHTFIFVGAQPPNGYTIASASGGDRMANLGNPPTNSSGVITDSRGNYLRARLKT